MGVFYPFKSLVGVVSIPSSKLGHTVFISGTLAMIMDARKSSKQYWVML